MSSDVKVSVQEGVVTCDPDVVKVTAASKNLVSFHLATAGYRFRKTDAIVMKQKSSDFPDPAQTVSDTLVQLKDLNRTQGVYAYSVTVVDDSDKEFEVDPGVENDGSGP